MDRLSTVYHPHCLVEPTSFPANIFKLCNWQWSLSTCWPAGSRGWEERKERTMVLKRSINQSIKKGKCMAPASSSVWSIKSGSKSHKILFYHYYFDGTSIRHLSILNDRSAASKFILYVVVQKAKRTSGIPSFTHASAVLMSTRVYFRITYMNGIISNGYLLSSSSFWHESKSFSVSSRLVMEAERTKKKRKDSVSNGSLWL